MLEHLRHLEIPRAVRTRLDHRHEPGPKVELRAEIVQVVDHVVEVDFQYGRMYLVFEDAADPFELEAASPF